MKNLKILLKVGMVLGQLLTAFAYAEIALDMNFRAIPGVIDQDGLESWKPITGPRDDLLQSEGAKPDLGGQMAIGRIIWDSHIYYATGTQYISHEQYMENRRTLLPSEKKTRVLPDGGVCELFLFDDKLQLVARHKVKLPDFPGGTWCNGSEALGRARKDMNALLYSIHYYLVSKPVAARPEDIGKGWRHSTYLIRLAKDSNGAIRFVQDDGCLGNPNDYATIVQARKALEKCPSNLSQ